MKKLKLILLFNILSILVSITGFSVAWFTSGSSTLDIHSVSGGVISQYFHCGSGTENDPYVITRPVHIYNLIQLQENLDGFAEEGNHFQLGFNLDDDPGLEFYSYDDNGVIQDGYSSTLNMNYYTLSPIGSEDNPFCGTFDGKGLVLDKLHISGEGASDIGVFGYVTEDATIKDLYIDNLDIDVTGAVPDAHTAHDTNAYVGYIAGHLEDANCVTNTYVNNCEITGQSTLTKNDWGYYGKCDNAASIDAFIQKASAGQGDDWGGSLDMKSFNNRIKNIFNTQSPSYFNTSSKNFTYISNDEMKITLGRGSTNMQTYMQQDPNTTQTFYVLLGDGNHYASSSTYQNMPGTVMPLLVNSDFSTSDKNTGYLISDTRAETSSTYKNKNRFNSSIRSSSYRIGHVGNSISDTAILKTEAYNSSGNASTVAFDASTAEILTNSSATYSANNYVLIKDTYNSSHTPLNTYLTNFNKNDTTTPAALGLSKYDAARSSLNDILDDATVVHGIHFMDQDLDYTNTATVNSVKINGTTYSNYLFPKSCIDFNLKENGKINFFGGSYYQNTNSESYADCFFGLSVINRDGQDLTSTSIQKISYIYKNTNTETNKTYPYIYYNANNSLIESGYTSSEVTQGELVFDMRYLSETPPVDNAIYYFEIPVNKGEYALHGVSGHDAGGYLMYLDIGASGADTDEDLVDNFKSVEYRSAPNTTESSILLITYMQSAAASLSIQVVYIEEDKRYNIICTKTDCSLTITLLNTNYSVYYNDTLILHDDIESYVV